jgi:hypothetical protein
MTDPSNFVDQVMFPEKLYFSTERIFSIVGEISLLLRSKVW